MNILSKFASIAFVLIVWEASSRLGLVDPMYLPPLSGAVASIFANAHLLTIDAGYSLARAFGGLAIGASVGVVLGMLMARYEPVDRFFDPLVGALFPTPKLALFPLLMVWLGLGEASKVTLIAISAFFPVALNTYAGIKGVDRFLIWNARSKGANQVQLLYRVMLPAALPFIFTGFRVATSFSFLLVVAAEMLSSNIGLGYRIMYAERTFETEQMYGALLLVACLGFIVDRLVGMLGRRLLAWQDTAL
jgi:ABC-type nitrate/sulfonate/bicarbonate transport system permease component